MEQDLLLIAGATRSGTTSLYRYLADHPDICPASRKETRFFLDEDYPGRSDFRYSAGIEKYWEYFLHADNAKYLLEATSDYMFARGVPQRLREMIGTPHVIFILRNPVERFLSWHRFAKQIGMIPSDTSLENYIAMQQPDEGTTPQHLRVMEQGHYHRYLQRFREALPNERLHVVWFEDLAESPRWTMCQLMAALGLPTNTYDTYEFTPHNVSYMPRSVKLQRVYTKTSFAVQKMLRKHPALRRMAQKINRGAIGPVYACLNGRLTPSSTPNIRSNSLEKLGTEYAGVYESMMLITGKRPPWQPRMEE